MPPRGTQRAASALWTSRTPSPLHHGHLSLARASALRTDAFERTGCGRRTTRWMLMMRMSRRSQRLGRERLSRAGRTPCLGSVCSCWRASSSAPSHFCGFGFVDLYTRISTHACHNPSRSIIVTTCATTASTAATATTTSRARPRLRFQRRNCAWDVMDRSGATVQCWSRCGRATITIAPSIGAA